MATIPQRAVWTYDDYLELPDDGNRYEILEGELIVSPVPSEPHQNASFQLGLILGNPIYANNLGKIYAAPLDVKLSQLSVVQPDLVFVARERRSIITHAHVQGPPDLVVEILSPGTAQRDLDDKMKIYARYGVRYYWILDPINRRLEAYELIGADYEKVAEAAGDATFTAPPFPDLAIPLARLWD